LQALELVNGKELAARLKAGAKALLASDLGKEKDADVVVTALYVRTLGRSPSAAELQLARPMIGSPSEKALARQEGWEDLLWVLAMSPEMQFIR
jgi:hypothetical protein